MSAMGPSDEQTDIGSPSAQITRNFSNELDGVFNLDSHAQVADLAFSVEAKKQTIESGEQELAALEARIKAAEAALQEKAAKAGAPAATGDRGRGEVPDDKVDRVATQERKKR